MTLLEQLHSLNKIQLIENFQKISMQEPLYTALRGFVISEDSAIKEIIIDSLIDRLESDSTSTETSIMNEAISIIPSLNSTTLSLLAIMSLRHFKIHPEISVMLDQYFCNLTPIVNNFKNVNNLTIDYIIQKRCTYPLNGLSRSETLENVFIHHYDLFFREKGDWTSLKEYAKLHPTVLNKVNEIGTCMFSVNGDMNEWSFLYVSSEQLYQQLHINGQDYLIPIIEELKQQVPPFSQADIKEYFKNINNNWDYVFSIMDSKIMSQTILNSVGLYIGSRYLSRHTGGKILSISSYKLWT